jgi:phosphoribosylformylglycinamidine synthase subunit PurQ / glutaminase
MKPRIGVVCFPGSNCEHDVAAVLSRLGATPELIWHTAERSPGLDAVVVPGGFAHGDYLRPGAIARFSPAMATVRRLADDGRPVLGICNGFQVLTEAGLLPGALMRNAGLRFISRLVECEVVSGASVLTRHCAPGTRLRLPINHYEGNFVLTDDGLTEARANDQVVLTYVDNPNGSLAAIAGIANAAGNVVGLMPHPERASGGLLESEDGLVLLASFVEAATRPLVADRA